MNYLIENLKLLYTNSGWSYETLANKLNEGIPEIQRFSKDQIRSYEKRFRKTCNDIGLSNKYTIYSFKHTRVCDLKQDGVPDADIMDNTGHSDFTAYTKYLRDLNLTADIKNINAKSRKI